MSFGVKRSQKMTLQVSAANPNTSLSTWINIGNRLRALEALVTSRLYRYNHRFGHIEYYLLYYSVIYGMTRQNNGAPDQVETARTLFNIIQCVKAGGRMTVTEVASELKYAKSTVHRHLHTLENLGYLVEDDHGFYVGLRFLDLGVHARECHSEYELACKMVDELASETDERAQFIVEEHGEAVYLARSVGSRAVRTDSGIGSRIPLHATAAGKAILSVLPEDRLFEIIEQTDFDSITDTTICDRELLLDELEQIRKRGYSFNRQENLDGLHAVGVPVKEPDNGVIGALSVSGPSHRLKGEWFENELPDLLLGAANELELNIAHSE